MATLTWRKNSTHIHQTAFVIKALASKHLHSRQCSWMWLHVCLSAVDLRWMII